MLRLPSLLALTVLLSACGPTPEPCRRDCWADCDRREIVACDLACPAGTSETPPTECMDGGAACERSCWSDCDRAQLVECSLDCPEGTVETAPICDAGPLPRDAGRPFFPDASFPPDTGVDGGPLHLCLSITQEQVEAVVYAEDGRRVPPGFYWDEPLPEGTSRRQLAPCAATIEDARSTAGRLHGAEQLTGTERTETRFFEVETLRPSDGETIVARVTRCDYLDRDGVLGDSSFAGLRDAAEYLWVTEHGADANRFVASTHSVVPDTYALCEVRRAIAANGCDRLDIYAEPRFVDDEGVIHDGSPAFVMRLQGACPDEP